MKHVISYACAIQPRCLIENCQMRPAENRRSCKMWPLPSNYRRGQRDMDMDSTPLLAGTDGKFPVEMAQTAIGRLMESNT